MSAAALTNLINRFLTAAEGLTIRNGKHDCGLRNMLIIENKIFLPRHFAGRRREKERERERERERNADSTISLTKAQSQQKNKRFAFLYNSGNRGLYRITQTHALGFPQPISWNNRSRKIRKGEIAASACGVNKQMGK